MIHGSRTLQGRPAVARRLPRETWNGDVLHWEAVSHRVLEFRVWSSPRNVLVTPKTSNSRNVEVVEEKVGGRRSFDY